MSGKQFSKAKGDIFKLYALTSHQSKSKGVSIHTKSIKLRKEAKPHNSKGGMNGLNVYPLISK